MALLEKVKDHFFHQNISRDVLQSKKSSSFLRLNRIVFITELKSDIDPRYLKTWSRQWREDVGSTNVIQRIFNKEEKLFVDRHFSPQDLDWKGVPKKAKMEELKRDRFDLLINLDHKGDKCMEYLSAAIHADLKIGHIENPLKIYDILVESKTKTLKGSLDSIEEILYKLFG